MGRPPCCDKIGVKKGPWTPEEDIILVSYIQEHGPGNWRAVPTNTDGQNLSSQEGLSSNSTSSTSSSNNSNKGQWERRLQTDIHMAKQALCEALSIDKPEFLPRTDSIPNPSFNQQSSIYASSTENIARLLENWRKPTPKSPQDSTQTTSCNNNNDRDEFKSLLSFNSNSNSNSNSTTTDNNSQVSASVEVFQDESKPMLGLSAAVSEEQVPLSLLEKWLFEEGVINHDHVNLMDMNLDDDTGADLF
uniref:Uncharacterized protein n=1 Tax=Chenopodium quinoa TaxID=63459 RepID=A0A803M151_CHEQI